MMKALRLKLFAIIFISKITFCLADSNTKPTDAALWTGFQLNQNLPGKWTAGYEYQSRFTRNLTFHRGFFQFLSITWKPLNFFSATLEYRNVNAFDGVTHRLGIELNFKKKWKRLAAVKRSVFQSERYSLLTIEQPSGFPSNFWRERLLFKFDLNKDVKLIASAEVFFSAHKTIRFQRLRTQAGLSVDLSKNISLTALWLFQEEYYVPRADITNAYILSTTFDLPKWQRGKKKKEKQKSAS
jgi:hypothetical protein